MISIIHSQQISNATSFSRCRAWWPMCFIWGFLHFSRSQDSKFSIEMFGLPSSQPQISNATGFSRCRACLPMCFIWGFLGFRMPPACKFCIQMLCRPVSGHGFHLVVPGARQALQLNFPCIYVRCGDLPLRSVRLASLPAGFRLKWLSVFGGALGQVS